MEVALKASIALATYNGSEYIEEQLNSFLSQTILPDELVVSDDNSTDDTLEIVYECSRKAPFSVRIYRNKERLGYVRNFNNAIEKCNGEIIFLSDQDDIWIPNKIEKVLNEFESHKDMLLIMNDAEIILQNGEKTGLTLLNQVRALGYSQEKFDSGCCMALRKELIPLILPIPFLEYKHDTWINKITTIFEVKKVINEILQYYRRHNQNNSSWIASRTEKVNKMTLIKEYRKIDQRKYLINRIKKLRILEERIDEYINGLNQTNIFKQRYLFAKNKISKEILAIEKRHKALKKKRVYRLLDVVSIFLRGEYKYFHGFKSFIKDIIMK